MTYQDVTQISVSYLDAGGEKISWTEDWRAQPFFGYADGDVVLKYCGTTHEDYMQLYNHKDLIMVGRVWLVGEDLIAAYYLIGNGLVRYGMPSRQLIMQCIKKALSKTELLGKRKFYVCTNASHDIEPLTEKKVKQIKTIMINESQMQLLKERNQSYDLCEIGEIVYSVDYDEDEYAEWLEENGTERSEESLKAYIKDESMPMFDIELLDSEYFHHLDYQQMAYYELEDEYGEQIAEQMLNDAIDGKEHSIETAMLFNDDEVDTSDVDAVQEDAMRKLKHGRYHDGARGFILPNGLVVYTESEHNMICQVAGIDSKFDAVEKYNFIRILDSSIDIGGEPSFEQEETLGEVIRSYSDGELYLDLFKDGYEYGVKYTYPEWRRVIADINRYYVEGIKPTGDLNEEDEHSLKDEYVIGSEDTSELNPYYHLEESLDLEYKPSDVDTDSFEKQDELEPHIWHDNLIDEKVRIHLLDIADDFFESLHVSWVEPEDIIIGGSICNYNWSDFSDIDLHIVVDFSKVDERTELVKAYFDSKKNQWADQHDNLKIYKYPVEVYVQDASEDLKSGGIYSLEQDKWLKEPQEDDIHDLTSAEKAKVKMVAASFMTIIDDIEHAIMTSDDKDELGSLKEELGDTYSKLKEKRQSGLDKDGESSLWNIVYKAVRREGYIDKIWELEDTAYDKIMSL